MSARHSPAFLAAVRFFLDSAGYCTPPGRVACAVELARAERAAKRLGWSLDWEPEPDPDDSFVETWEPRDARAYRVAGVDSRGRDIPREHEHEMATLRDADGEPLETLGGIIDADASYRRVIFAELASQALAVRASSRRRRARENDTAHAARS